MKKNITFILFFLFISSFLLSETSYNLCGKMCLSPKTTLKTTNPNWTDANLTRPLLEFTEGRTGIEHMLSLMESELADKILHSPLAKRNIKLSFSHLKGAAGSHYLVVDIYTKDKYLQSYINNINRHKSQGRYEGDITGLIENTMGRMMILVSKSDGYAIPMLWEIQPASAASILQTTLTAKYKNSDALLKAHPEFGWRKDTAQAIARLCTNYGFKDFYARSATSMKKHPKYSITPKYQQGIKDYISPKDVKFNYKQTFNNSDNWTEDTPTEYDLWFDLKGYQSREFDLHKYKHADTVLLNKGIRHYRLQEITTKNNTHLLIVFENEKINTKFTFSLNQIMDKLKDVSLPKENLTQEEIIKLLRFKYKVPMFGKPEKIIKNQKTSLTLIASAA